MLEFASLVPMLVVIGLTAAPMVVLIRVLAGAEASPPVGARAPWPQGVQEEEPRPWRFAPVG